MWDDQSPLQPLTRGTPGATAPGFCLAAATRFYLVTEAVRGKLEVAGFVANDVASGQEQRWM